jgi:hypothetical protein
VNNPKIPEKRPVKNKMKKIILLLVCFASFVVSQAQVSASKNYGAYIGPLDTLTNADNNTITTTIAGSKSTITYQIHVLKISGTMVGAIKLYTSADGVNWPSAATDSLTLADGNGNYQIRRTNNSGVKHRIIVSTTGTSVASNRVYLFWRE